MNLRPKQSLGQNFLRDPNIIRKILESLRAPSDAHVVEIGPGEGALTEPLSSKYPRFTAIEIDERAVRHLRERLPDADIRQQDILQVDWRTLADETAAPLYVIGNLPYNITSQILIFLLDARHVIEEAVLMMQKEVAERLVAEPRTKAYGILSVQTQVFADAELMFTVSPKVFFPRPDVMSAVVRLTFPREKAEPSGRDAAFFRDVVRAAFNQRRKTLRNSLRAWTRERGIELPGGLAERRAEELSPAEFVGLAHYLGARR